MKAFVLVNVRSGFEETALNQVKSLVEVDTVDVIFGKYDLHMTVYFDSLVELDEFVMGTLRSIEGVHQTTTLLSIEI